MSAIQPQSNLRIAYLGPEATFTVLAAIKKFGPQGDYVSCRNISEVFSRVEGGKCDYGVVPIENSIEGAVTHTFDLLVDSDLKICSQVLLRISLNLIARTALDERNITRFLVLSNTDVPPTGKDRTSLVFSIKDKVGALHAMLAPFYKNNINLTKIESRPSKRKAWDYYFFVDIQGHRLDPHVSKALAQLKGMCQYLKILGSYPE